MSDFKVKPSLKKVLSYKFYEVYRDREVNFAKPKVDDRMTCPFCGEPLVEGEPKRIQDLEEHVSNPNGIPSLKRIGYCKNPNCKFRDFYGYTLHDGGAFKQLDESGELRYYSYFFKGDEVDPDKRKDYEEINTYRVCAGNSFDAEASIVIYKKGQLNSILLSPMLTFGLSRPVIEFNYRANRKGEVTGRSMSLKFIKWDGRSEYCISSPGYLRMIRYIFREYKRSLKRILKSDDLTKYRMDLYRIFHKNNYEWPDKDQSWRWAGAMLMRLSHPIIYIKLKPIFKRYIYEKTKEII